MRSVRRQGLGRPVIGRGHVNGGLELRGRFHVRNLFGCRSLVDVYRLRAERQPDVVGYRFLPGGGAPELELTYAALDRRARAIANALVERARPGERAILLFTPGLEYITAFVACLYAGIVAVPASPPHPRRPDERVPGLVEDCGARIALTTSTLMTRLARWRASEPTIDAMHWVATDAVEATETRWCPERVGSERLAMLQYTSGSTSAPRGVRLTHANLMANLESVFHRFAHREGDIGVF